MSSRQRLMFLFGIVLVCAFLITTTGLPYFRLTLALGEGAKAQVVAPYTSSSAANCPLINLDNGVVGTILTTSPIYWQPDLGSAIATLHIDEGQSFWALGHNEADNFYQIVIGCTPVWVPTENIGPTYAYPWLGRPLPDIVIS